MSLSTYVRAGDGLLCPLPSATSLSPWVFSDYCGHLFCIPAEIAKKGIGGELRFISVLPTAITVERVGTIMQAPV